MPCLTSRKSALFMGGSAVLLALSLSTPTHAAPTDAAWGWGFNIYGQLGYGSAVDTHPTHVAVNSPMDGAVSAVGAGFYHSLGLTSSGAVYAWGRGDSGELGNGANSHSSSPVAVNTLTSNVTAISAGGNFSLAIQNGNAFSWGANGSGQLGNGNNTNSNTPIQILTGDVTAISAGGDATEGPEFALAVQNGAAYAWGKNANGQLGDGTNTDSNTPVAVSSLTSGVTAVSAGGYHSLAIKNGAVYAWGYNGQGELGNGTFTSSNTPVAASVLTSGVTDISAGSYHSLAIMNGDVYSWGYDASGQLGNGAGGSSVNTPTMVLQVVGVPFVRVVASKGSSFALSSDGSIWSWGLNNYYGEAGFESGSPAQYDTPQHLLPPTGYVYTSIDSAHAHVIATLAAIPEPASAALLAAGGLLVLPRRRD